MLKTIEDIFGPHHLKTIYAKHNYAVALEKLDKFKEAEKYYLLAINGCDVNASVDRKLKLKFKQSYGNTLFLMRRFGEAA